MLDKFYTPHSVARLMVSFSKLDNPMYIADFASGDGILLYYAFQRWPNASFYANDISSEALSAMKNHNFTYKVENIDFLSNDLREKSPIMQFLKKKSDLILLNPPYSFRGQFKFLFKGNYHFNCPRSLAFVLIATEFLADHGELIALLPSGAIYGVRGRETLDYFQTNFSFEVLETFSNKTFNLCSAKTVIVKFSRRDQEKIKLNANKNENTQYEIIRGNMPMYRVVEKEKSKHRIIHSTSIQRYIVKPLRVDKNDLARKILGHNVLIQRVGNIKKHKIVHFHTAKKVMLSDCVIAIPTRSKKESEFIINYVHDNWDRFLEMYTGTCAKHLAIQDLKSFLATCPRFIEEV